MPTYDYKCSKCAHIFEVFHSISDKSARHCPQCGSESDKQIGSGGGVLFKGSGFYTTDYRSEGYNSAAKQDKS